MVNFLKISKSLRGPMDFGNNLDLAVWSLDAVVVLPSENGSYLISAIKLPARRIARSKQGLSDVTLRSNCFGINLHLVRVDSLILAQELLIGSAIKGGLNEIIHIYNAFNIGHFFVFSGLIYNHSKRAILYVYRERAVTCDWLSFDIMSASTIGKWTNLMPFKW